MPDDKIDEKPGAVPKALPGKVMIATAFAFGAALGGTGTAALTPDQFETSARPSQVRLLPDGQIAIGFKTLVGDNSGDREIVFAVDGSNPRLNGRPTDDSSVKKLAASAVAFKATASKISPALADKVTDTFFVADGQMVIEVKKKISGKNISGQLVFSSNGSNPRLNGVLVAAEFADDIGSALVDLHKASKNVDVELLTKPLLVDQPGKKGGDIPAERDLGPPNRSRP